MNPSNEIRSWLSGFVLALAIICTCAAEAARPLVVSGNIEERHQQLVIFAAQADQQLKATQSLFRRQMWSAVTEIRDAFIFTKIYLASQDTQLTPAQLAVIAEALADEVFRTYGVNLEGQLTSDVMNAWKQIESSSAMATLPQPGPSASPTAVKRYQDSLQLQQALLVSGSKVLTETVAIGALQIKLKTIAAAKAEVEKYPTMNMHDAMIQKLNMLIQSLDPQTKSPGVRVRFGSPVS